MVDILIIGAGPAGLCAAVYARRAGKSVKIVEKSAFGGQITFSPRIENFPAFEEISGTELADRMVAQAMALGADVDCCEIASLRRDAADNCFTAVDTDGAEHRARAVILAVGAAHRRLGLEGEEELIGNGISFCAVCDGAFYAGKDVIVVGGGNSAAVEAELLARTCASVTVIQNLPALTCEQAAAARLLGRDNVTVLTDTVVTSYVTDEGKLIGAETRNTATGEEGAVAADGIFIAVGLSPANGPFADLLELDGWGYAAAGEDCASRIPGLYVAGDCRTKSVRQITTAAADGAVAALAACRYVENSL